ncbi:MAG: glycoside hydrolase family 127 protein, partial [Caldilineaceae bacterium SB0665_bin_21]|nr:glycoside hydrolase family 127 protein [Caldilineaceae bacterium SB0665_bin_21]
MHVDTSASEFTEYRTLALTDAKVVGGFWSQRQSVNRKSSLNHAFEKLEASGNFNNLKLAIGEGEGSYREPLFLDSDIYKWLEAVGCALANEPDAGLQAKAEYAIGLLARTQEPDGYLNSYYQVLKPGLKWLE